MVKTKEFKSPTTHAFAGTPASCVAVLDQAMVFDEELSSPRVKKALERFMAAGRLTLPEAIARLVRKALVE